MEPRPWNVLVPPQLLNVVMVQPPELEQQVPRNVADWQKVLEVQAKVALVFTPTPAKTLAPVQPTPVVIEQVPVEEQQVPRARLHALSGTQVVLSPR